VKDIILQAKQLLDADRCSLFLVDKDNEQLISQFADGTDEIRIGIHEGIVGM
jgi:hypothetical protein